MTKPAFYLRHVNGNYAVGTKIYATLLGAEKAKHKFILKLVDNKIDPTNKNMVDVHLYFHNYSTVDNYKDIEIRHIRQRWRSTKALQNHLDHFYQIYYSLGQEWNIIEHVQN